MAITLLNYPSCHSLGQLPVNTFFLLNFLNIDRYPDVVDDEFANDYNIVTVTETVTYKDGSTGTSTYCHVLKGKQY